MGDRYVETSSQSWFSRLGGAFKGILFGFLLLVGGVVLLFWSEGRAVKRAKALDEGAGVVVSVGAARLDAANEGRLVHVIGEATTEDRLADPVFGVARQGVIRLRREVSMFQWIEDKETETKKKVGGGTTTTTTYTYRTGWVDHPVSSADFKEAEGHRNPPFPYEGESWQADRVTLGAFTLGSALLGQLDREEPLALGVDSLSGVRSPYSDQLRPDGEGFFRGADPTSPRVGDLRIRFAVVPPATVSVVAGQQQGQLVRHQTRAGGTLALLSYGTRGADEMFQAAQAANTGLLWVLRLLGFVVLVAGFSAILRPLSVLADVLPFLGNLVGTGTFFVSLLLAGIVWLVTVAVGWIVYRPLFGVTLLIATIALVVLLVRRARRRPGRVTAAISPPPPPPA